MGDESVKVRIGGEEIELPRILNFAQLERTWPAVEAYSAAASGVQEISAALAFFAGLLVETRPELNLAELKKRTRVERFDPATDSDLSSVDERPGIHTALSEICKASGLIPRRPPETPAAEAATGNPSTAIGNT